MTEKEKKAPVGTIRENIADQMPKKNAPFGAGVHSLSEWIPRNEKTAIVSFQRNSMSFVFCHKCSQLVVQRARASLLERPNSNRGALKSPRVSYDLDKRPCGRAILRIQILQPSEDLVEQSGCADAIDRRGEPEGAGGGGGAGKCQGPGG